MKPAPVTLLLLASAWRHCARFPSDLVQEVLDVAGHIRRAIALPDKAATDAGHVAVAAVHGIDYLLTWNCRHIANAALRPKIEDVCRAAGYRPPVICTPDELLEVSP
ncbi:MAG: hypothetical protein ACREIT_08260 [Tepidisphaeraceae bacterium]